MTNRQWFTLHSWAGFAFAGLLLLICATGVLATVSYEIQYLSDEKYRALSDRNGPVNWAQLESNLVSEYADSHILGGGVHAQDYLAGEVRLMTPQGFRFVYFDPATGTLLGEGGWGQLSRFLRNIHMYLSMGSVGKYIVTLTSLLLIISLVSSFYVYRKWWRGFLNNPGKLSWKKRIDWSGWHKWIGLWTWWFVALMAFTGLWYLIERMMFDFDLDHYPASPTVQHSEPQQSQRALPVTELVAKARAARPDMDITGFYYPHGYNQPMSLVGQNDSILVRDRANRVYLDPITGEVVSTQYAADLGLVARIADTADPLHFGNFSGLTVKLIYALFGLMLTALVAGGMRMHYLRTQQRDPNVAKWLSITGSISIAISIAALVYTSIEFDQYSNTSKSLSPQLGELTQRVTDN
ncbi:Uncharacterized iron-regulated membrane protein [Pseudidiomarina planktonica]|uniref:Uncharacterized iron-regulated membrane protein n=1 Tax=Pseudidiomarina planktonica TaxID=1323738 RepID=A0A1Y6F1Y4_9GAMM|nr:PepSY-associated TM helix domain-containing protein [Pseudidiomarina planktonica]RUO65107.1 hypothetical protein CWI77_01120 [Pseudidiomarina planktonica]SMQ66463.1 Uncharacterized iron-regulated membrane protein [Pseudidiomarina planktonica]